LRTQTFAMSRCPRVTDPTYDQTPLHNHHFLLPKKRWITAHVLFSPFRVHENGTTS